MQSYGRCLSRALLLVTVTTFVTFVTTLAFLRWLNAYVEEMGNRKFEGVCLAAKNCR